MLFLLIFLPICCLAEDTVKRPPIKIFEIDKVKVIEDCILNFNYNGLLKYSQDSIVVELLVEKETLVEAFSKYDALEILSTCQQIFNPTAYNIYYAKDGETENYIVELEDETKNVKSFFYLFFLCGKLEFVEIFK